MYRILQQIVQNFTYADQCINSYKTIPVNITEYKAKNIGKDSILGVKGFKNIQQSVYNYQIDSFYIVKFI